MRIGELVAAADANETYARFAVDIFQRRHSSRVVRFDNLKDKIVSWTLPIQIIDQSITIRQMDVALSILKYFGQLIPSIEIHHSDLYTAQSDPKEFYNHINLYCADNLKSLKLNTNDEHLFAGMTKPFAQVETLSIAGRFESFASETLTFSELFPRVRDLNLEPDQIDDKSSTDQAFPHLETLSIAFHYNVLLEEDFEKLMRKNAQIRKLSVSYSSPKFIQTVNEILPNITDLRLLDYNRHNESVTGYNVTFKHVTNFAVSMRLGNLPENIFFENLKELRVDSYANRDWLFFVERNLGLEKLIFESGLIYNEKFKRIIALNLNLREVSLCINYDVTDANVISFVRNHKNVNRFCFKTWGKHSEEYSGLGEVLQNELGKAFNVTTRENVLLIERV